jgi:thiol:disulfide interchange protein
LPTLWHARHAAIVGLALLGSALGPAAFAAESPPVQSTRSIATLVTATDRVADGTTLHAALRLRLTPGWHTYWQNPGDAGIPPSLDLSLSPGAHAGPLQWPLPQRVAEGTLTTYAYTGDVVLPFDLTPGPGELSIKAHAEWLACKDICVPEEADLALTLPPGVPTPSPEADLISAATARVPQPAPWAATIAPDGTLTLSGKTVPHDTARAEFFPTASGLVEHADLQRPTVQADSLTLKLDPTPPASAPALEGVVALTDRSGATQAYAVAPTPIAASQPVPLLGPLLLLALAGGLLLNLMPCVFPILAMKAMALARLSGTDMRRVRMEAASYSLGVVGSFTALGALLTALREAGDGDGWGFQFQSPSFVIAVTWVLFAVGLSLSGVFTVGSSLMGRGQSLTSKPGHLGSFLTGVLAVVVASPCTAPFMGTAIAGALALPAEASLLVFAGLGVGLALPYAVLASIPRLSRILPRPGGWMVTLQQLLAFPMYAATVWLVWVVSQQSGPAGVLMVGAGLVAVGAGAWLLGLANRSSVWGRNIARGAAAVVGIALAGLLYTGSATHADPAEPFTTARFDELRNEGRPVFVNMTAAWCLSCLVNEEIALSPAAVQDAFARSHVAYLKGDWTSKNPTISAYLHQLGRDGVPLYVLYPPGRDPVVLPEILSAATVLDELAKLKS